MLKKYKIPRNKLELLRDFMILWLKYNKNDELDNYSFALIDILTEYDYIIKYRPKGWRRII